MFNQDVGKIKQGDICLSGRETRDCLFISDVRIRGIYWSLDYVLLNPNNYVDLSCSLRGKTDLGGGGGASLFASPPSLNTLCQDTHLACTSM